MDILIGTAIPPYWKSNPVRLTDVPRDYKPDQLLGVECQCPLSMKWEEENDYWQLPLDPVIAVRGRNTIVMRSVLKVRTGDKERRGTVKELWSQGDYEVSIAGLLQNSDHAELPETAIRKLRNYCEGRESVLVINPLLNLFGIKRIAIEQFEFPHTAGIANQQYVLTCHSDDYYKESLLIAD